MFKEKNGWFTRLHSGPTGLFIGVKIKISELLLILNGNGAQCIICTSIWYGYRNPGYWLWSGGSLSPPLWCSWWGLHASVPLSFATTCWFLHFKLDPVYTRVQRDVGFRWTKEKKCKSRELVILTTPVSTTNIWYKGVYFLAFRKKFLLENILMMKLE